MLHGGESTMSESVPVKSVWEHLQEMPDPRSRRGRSYPMAGLLGLVILGALHGECSLRGMWMWGCKHWQQIARPLGLLIGREHPPAYNTLRYLLRALHTQHLASLEAWMQAQPGGEAEAISVDGKHLEGSRRLQPPRPALEVVTAVGQEMKLVLGQEEVAAGGEVAAAVALLKRLPLRGRVVVADAGLLCRPVVDAILEGEGDYLGVVKANQPQLYEALETWGEPQISPPGTGTTRR
jgi:hypothetical protein